MKDTSFRTQGYAVVKDKESNPQFLSRSPSSQGSGGAIGQGGSNWTSQPTVDSLFSDKQTAQKLAQEHQGDVISCNVQLEVSQPQTA